MGSTRQLALTDQRYEHLKYLLPHQREDLKVDIRRVLSAILFMVEQRCKWRGLPKRFDNWHTIYMQMSGPLFLVKHSSEFRIRQGA